PLCGTFLNPTLSYPAVGVQRQHKSRCAARTVGTGARPGDRGTRPLPSLAANSRPVNGRGQLPRGMVCIWCVSAIKMVEALEGALPGSPAGVGAGPRPPPHILSRSEACRLREGFRA